MISIVSLKYEFETILNIDNSVTIQVFYLKSSVCVLRNLEGIMSQTINLGLSFILCQERINLWSFLYFLYLTYVSILSFRALIRDS